jgi:hypothetical protein
MRIAYLYEQFTENKKGSLPPETPFQIYNKRKQIFRALYLSLAMEGQGSSDEEYTVIESTADSLDSSVIFHVINDVVGFVLYMYQQIPS